MKTHMKLTIGGVTSRRRLFVPIAHATFAEERDMSPQPQALIKSIVTVDGVAYQVWESVDEIIALIERAAFAEGSALLAPEMAPAGAAKEELEPLPLERRPIRRYCDTSPESNRTPSPEPEKEIGATAAIAAGVLAAALLHE